MNSLFSLLISSITWHRDSMWEIVDRPLLKPLWLYFLAWDPQQAHGGSGEAYCRFYLFSLDLNFTIHLFIGWFRQCDRFLQLKYINWSDRKPTWDGTEAVLFLSDSDTCFGSIIHNLNSSRLWLVNCTHKCHWQCYSECSSLAWISAASPTCWVTQEVQEVVEI